MLTYLHTRYLYSVRNARTQTQTHVTCERIWENTVMLCHSSVQSVAKGFKWTQQHVRHLNSGACPGPDNSK